MMNHSHLFHPAPAVVVVRDDVQLACENDPTMINRGAFHLRRRRTNQRIDDDDTTANTVPMTIKTTLTPPTFVPVVVTRSSQRQHDRPKSVSPWICTGSMDAVVTTSHSSSGDTISPSRSNHHHHRRRRHNVSSHHHHNNNSNNTTIRTWQAAVRGTSHSNRISDPSKVVHIHDLTDEIEITCSMLSLRKPHSKFWRSSQSPTSVMDAITTATTSSSSSSGVRDHDDSLTTTNTTTKPPSPPRAVRFNIDLNHIIDSELSSDHIKEYRKQMWWSHKDRARSMKQRDVELQEILKENQISTTTSIRPTSTEELLRLEPDDHDATLPSTTDASSTTTQEMSTGNHPVPSEYCQAVLTLLLFCQDSHLQQSDENDTTATTPLLEQAIRTIVGSKYRGLERIVGKILQLQKVSLWSVPADSMPLTHAAAAAATIMAHDTTIEVVHSHVPPASDDATAATMADPTPASTLLFATNTATNTWTAVHIRKRFLNYQGQLRPHGHNNRHRRPNGDGEDRPVPDFGQDPTNAEMTNISTLVHPAVLLSQYYTSFPGHAIAIRWAQLMAMGDEWILVESR